MTFPVLLLTLPEGIFDAAVPVLIPMACALMISRPSPQLTHGPLSPHRNFALIATGVATGVAVGVAVGV